MGLFEVGLPVTSRPGGFHDMVLDKTPGLAAFLKVKLTPRKMQCYKLCHFHLVSVLFKIFCTGKVTRHFSGHLQ